MSDEMSRARRVQQQVQMRMAEKSTLPRQNGSASHYAKSGKHQDVFKEKKEKKKEKDFHEDLCALCVLLRESISTHEPTNELDSEPREFRCRCLSAHFNRPKVRTLGQMLLGGVFDLGTDYIRLHYQIMDSPNSKTV